MIRFLFKPLSLLFIGIYIGFVFWLLSGTKDEDLSDFPWGNTYLENTNGKLSELVRHPIILIQKRILTLVMKIMITLKRVFV